MFRTLFFQNQWLFIDVRSTFGDRFEAVWRTNFAQILFLYWPVSFIFSCTNAHPFVSCLLTGFRSIKIATGNKGRNKAGEDLAWSQRASVYFSPISCPPAAVTNRMTSFRSVCDKLFDLWSPPRASEPSSSASFALFAIRTTTFSSSSWLLCAQNPCVPLSG